MRIFQAVIGISTLPLIALAGYIMGGSSLSWVATFLLAVAPLHVYFSREGRPYAALMFLSCLLLVVLLRPRERWSVPIAYLACISAAYWGAMSAPLLVAFGCLALVQFLGGIRTGLKRGPGARWDRRRHFGVHLLLASVIGMAIVVMLYIDFETAPQYAPDFSKPRSAMVTESNSLRALNKFGASMTTSGVTWRSMERRSVILLSLALVGTIAGLTWRRRETMLTLAMFLLTALASFGALIAMGRFYGGRYTCSSLPAFILLVSLGIVGMSRWISSLVPDDPSSGKLRSTIGSTVCLIMVVFVAGPNIAASRADPFEKLDWKGLARMIHDAALEGEVVVAASRWPFLCLSYYNDQMSEPVKIFDAGLSVDVARSIVERSGSTWLVTAGIRNAGEMRKWMHRYDHVESHEIAELDAFFAPDFRTLIATRYAANREQVFVNAWDRQRQRFDFEAGELLLQGSGWSFPEVNSEGTTFQWATSQAAELALPSSQPGNRQIRFRALPFWYPDAPAQRVELSLNSVFIDSIELGKGWSEHQVEIPASAWTGRGDILTLHLSRTTSPAEVIPGSVDRRYLGAAFDYLEVVSVSEDR